MKSESILVTSVKYDTTKFLHGLFVCVVELALGI